ncbi:MAG: hypothetical protein WCK65_10820 [Rhodospirillaceae bacterium]
MQMRSFPLSQCWFVAVCFVMAAAGLVGCTSNQGENPFSQEPFLWPATTSAAFTVRTSDWLDTPEEVRDLIATQCGPAFKTARIIRHDGAGSLLHADQLSVYCGDLKPRAPVYPEPGSGPLSENLATLESPLTGAETGELITLR